MFYKIFCILLLQLYFSRAHLQDTSKLTHSPDNRDNNALDCRAKVPVQKHAPLNTDALVLQSAEDDSPLNSIHGASKLEPAQAKRPYVSDHNALGNSDNKKNVDNSVVQNPESGTFDEISRRKANLGPQNDSKKLDDSDKLQDSDKPNPSLLSKLIEKCVTKRLLTAQKNGKLHLEDLPNGRRSNSFDSSEETDAILDVDEQLVDPAEAEGSRRLNGGRLNNQVSLIDHRRVCYACTSASNPNCWEPNNLTTVKYCRNEHHSCTSKTYQAGDQLVIVRDCGNTCASTLGIDPLYKSCSICKSDFCNTNGADSVSTHGLILCLFIISFIKTVF